MMRLRFAISFSQALVLASLRPFVQSFCVDYCWTVIPFGFRLSPWCYHTLSEAKAAFLRSNGIPALAYLDDSWLSNFFAAHGGTAREQWLAAGEATPCGNARTLHVRTVRFQSKSARCARPEHAGVILRYHKRYAAASMQKGLASSLKIALKE